MRVTVVVPAGFDDPRRPSGGNSYDQRICAGLVEAGWDVRVATVETPWAMSAAASRIGLSEAMAAVPDGELVLVDGLIASPAAAELLPHAHRLRLTVLVHMPAADGASEPSLERSELAVLESAAAVVVTSEWTRRQVLERFALAADRVTVAVPGVDLVPMIHPASRNGGRLLCVGTLCHHKGQDVLLDALIDVADTAETENRADAAAGSWSCRLVGPTDRDPDFVGQLRRRIASHALDSRIQLTGVLHGQALQAAYADADLLIAPSRRESYGMAVSEALARSLPVIATSVGGLPEALGSTADGSRPGTLIARDRPDELAGALRTWLHDPSERSRLRAAAAERRPALPSWEATTRAVAAALTATSRQGHETT